MVVLVRHSMRLVASNTKIHCRRGRGPFNSELVLKPSGHPGLGGYSRRTVRRYVFRGTRAILLDAGMDDYSIRNVPAAILACLTQRQCCEGRPSGVFALHSTHSACPLPLRKTCRSRLASAPVHTASSGKEDNQSLQRGIPAASYKKHLIEHSAQQQAL